jgi:hypothetical protein
LDKGPQPPGIRSKNLIHGALNRAVQISIPGRGEQMRVGAQKRIERGAVEVFPEDIDGVRAEKVKRVSTQQPIPKLFETNGGGELACLPKNTDHLAVGAESGVVRLRADYPDQGSDGTLEPLPIGLSIDHESGKGLLCIGKEKPRLADGGVRVGAGFAKVAGQSRIPFLGCDHQERITLFQTFQEVVTDVSGEKRFVGIVELYDVARGF